MYYIPRHGGRGKCCVAISFIEEGVTATCGTQPPVWNIIQPECPYIHTYIHTYTEYMYSVGHHTRAGPVNMTVQE